MPTEVASTTPTSLRLMRPPHDDQLDPELTILIPAVDEETTITEFVEWCFEGLAAAEVSGEVLIVDGSTDGTPALALAAGARVLTAPRRGLGRAYIDAIPYIRGRYVLMGDADCTYDFRDLKGFVTKMRTGYQFAMGSRWLGSIQPGAMPKLHQYLGTPLTTWILNKVYGSRFTDIHCGMRAITRDALLAMGLTSQSWEYASEMVLKSVRMQLRTAEVPVTFLKDRNGRLSHHKRAGWGSPFRAAWANLREVFIYGADFFALKPGLALLTLGLAFTLPLVAGPLRVGGLTLNLYWMLLGLTLAVLGTQSFFFGCLAQSLCDYTGSARAHWLQVFEYTRTIFISAFLFVSGLVLALLLAVHYVTHHLSLGRASDRVDHLAVVGVLFMILGFSMFCFTLVLHATTVEYGSTHEHR